MNTKIVKSRSGRTLKLRVEEPREQDRKHEPEQEPRLTAREQRIVVAREQWVAQLPDDEVSGLEGLHPDQCMVACPPEFLLNDEWETRHGRGYVLGDGAWYNPLTGGSTGSILVDNNGRYEWIIDYNRNRRNA